MRLPPRRGETNPDMDGLKILFSPKDPKKNPQKAGFRHFEEFKTPRLCHFEVPISPFAGSNDPEGRFFLGGKRPMFTKESESDWFVI